MTPETETPVKYQYVDDTYFSAHRSRRVEFSSDASARDPEWLAMDAAYRFFRVTNGDTSWPRDFEIYADGKSLGIYHVEIINEPQFFAVPCTPENRS